MSDCSDPARLKAHIREYHADQPGVKANYMVMFKSVKIESNVEENNYAKSRSSRWSSSLVPKNQLEGYTIDEEAKANTVWVNVPTIKQGTSPSRGRSRSSVVVSNDDSDDDYDSDATISVTDGNYDSDATISVTDGGDIYSTQGYPLLVLHRVLNEDIEQMTTSTETFHNIFA